MKITYIHHSSFLVEMEQIALLFDYFEGEIPEIRQDQLLIVFASHRHGDHFSPGILIWQRIIPKSGLSFRTISGEKEFRRNFCVGPVFGAGRGIFFSEGDRRKGACNGQSI